ncbi:acyl-CoA dehydrogenase family protein [Novosphingobium mathurense]|uniref:Acyl-CoA dehydrogenase n=1 Tax=Novosphingobium mathurense TaxID=428990 RepID=A0A1U6IQN9_9SPHN|nr:acyl-CoA dehydrogenase family protein [Novosphingobium mathurense]SLK10349.1 hypothetical protein SAMN06295987_11153 [Novosphingobium mathurense]
MPGYSHQAARLQRHLEIAPFIDELLEASGGTGDMDLWQMVVEEASRLSEGVVAPIDSQLDQAGLTMENGRVRTIPAHGHAWQAYVQAGWLTADVPADQGGQGLPLAVLSACEELMNRASPAFMMLPTAVRCATALLHDAADPAVYQAWLPHLTAGSWTATICISEPDAGSDVGRIRTSAALGADGIWRVTGEKCWISYGSHDLAERIGHCILARTSPAPGVRGLSLFLVPDRAATGEPNGVVLRRIEEKMGLHGSPTCAIGFEDAHATLLGKEGAGLQHMFRMMSAMRLSCGPQGTGVASGSFHVALDYARERRQGGDPVTPPVAIAEHPDIQRLLLSMAGRIEAARGLNIAAAAALDVAGLHADQAVRDDQLALAQWLLPIVKDGAARLAFEISSDAMQVLGGAGYTREWPIERHLRDSRVFSIYEGTSGIQAIDLLERRLKREKGRGLRIFLDLARREPGGGQAFDAELQHILAMLERTSGMLAQCDGRTSAAAATPFLRLATIAAHAWIAARILRLAGDDATGRSMKAAASAFMSDARHLADLEAARASGPDTVLDDFPRLYCEG